MSEPDGFHCDMTTELLLKTMFKRAGEQLSPALKAHLNECCICRVQQKLIRDIANTARNADADDRDFRGVFERILHDLERVKRLDRRTGSKPQMAAAFREVHQHLSALAASF